MSEVDPEDLCIPIRMSTSANLRRAKHIKWMAGGVDCVAVAADVVSGVVHGHLFS